MGNGKAIARRPTITPCENFIPTTGAVAVTSGAANAFGAWTPLQTINSDVVLSQLMSVRTTTLLALARMTTEFGYGAGPTALDALYETYAITDPTGDDGGAPGSVMPAAFPVIPANQSFQARINDSRVANAVYNVWAAGWYPNDPVFVDLPHFRLGTAQFYPSNISVGITTSAVAAPNFGNYVDVINPAPNDILIVYITPCTGVPQAISPFTGYRLAIGAVGQEIPLALLPTGNMVRPSWINPPIWLKQGEILRVQSTSNVAGVRQIVAKGYNM